MTNDLPVVFKDSKKLDTLCVNQPSPDSSSQEGFKAKCGTQRHPKCQLDGMITGTIHTHTRKKHLANLNPYQWPEGINPWVGQRSDIYEYLSDSMLYLVWCDQKCLRVSSHARSAQFWDLGTGVALSPQQLQVMLHLNEQPAHGQVSLADQRG